MAPAKSFKFQKGASRKPSKKLTRAAQNSITSRKQTTKSEKPIKAVFKDKVISVAGNITTCSKDARPITYDQISNWVTLHGGEFEREVNESTTHLICSIEEYKKGSHSQQVRKAWDLGKRQCQIVVFDWLEDCLLGRKLKKGLKSERGYTLDRTLARIKKGKTDHDEYRKRFEENARASKALCDNRLNHVYQDDTNFEYKIALTRVKIAYDGKIMTEKYTVYLFESNAGPPHLYMTGAMLSRSHRPHTHYRDCMYPQPFYEAFASFRKFFQIKTGVDWDSRLEGIKVPDMFVYTPPVLGRPVGLVPQGYIRPEFRPTPPASPSPTDRTKNSESSEEKDVIYDTDSEAEYSESDHSETVRGKPARSFSSSTSGSTSRSRSSESGEESGGDDSADESGMRNGGKFGVSRGSAFAGGSGEESGSSSQQTNTPNSSFEVAIRDRMPERREVIYLSD